MSTKSAEKKGIKVHKCNEMPKRLEYIYIYLRHIRT